MSKYTNRIQNYGESVGDIETSAFEAVDMLHQRSNIEKSIHELTNQERISLYSYDLKLINHARQMSDHIGEIYDFTSSDEPISEWWWHLDKVADGKISFNLITEIKQD